MHHELERLRLRYPDIAECVPAVAAAFDLLAATFRGGGKLLICGSGGSAADSDHIVGELMKGFERARPIPDDFRKKLAEVGGELGAYLADRLQGALPAIALPVHPALSTAIANDTAGDMTFAQQVYGYGSDGDALLAISTSGNSTSVLCALHVARARGLRTIGLTGRTGGTMRGLCDVCICVPYDRTSDIQERHLPVYHALCKMLEQEFFA